MIIIVAFLSLVGAPTTDNTTKPREELLLLLEISDSQARYDELKGLERIQPDGRFTDVQLKVLIDLMLERPKIEDLPISAIPRAALHIVKHYYSEGLLNPELKLKFIKNLRTLSRQRKNTVLKAESSTALEVIRHPAKQAKRKSAFIQSCLNVLSKIRAAFKSDDLSDY